jgi:hypothetical protein
MALASPLLLYFFSLLEIEISLETSMPVAPSIFSSVVFYMLVIEANPLELKVVNYPFELLLSIWVFIIYATSCIPLLSFAIRSYSRSKMPSIREMLTKKCH